MRISRPGLAYLVVIVAGIAGFLGRPAHGQAVTSCDCPDVFELINRLNMDEAAISALKFQLAEFEATDRSTGRPSSMADPHASGVSNQNHLRAAINGAMKDVQMLGAQTSIGDTNGLCRSGLETSSTRCMNEIVMFHEDNVHVPACERDRAAGRTTAIGFRAPLSTAAYIKEEIAGYESEIRRIREVLRLLPDSCRQKGWVGLINYFEEQSMDSETTVNGANGSTSTQKTTRSFKRQARIVYRESVSLTGNTSVTENITRTEVASGRTSCTGGLRLTPADRTVTGTLVEKQEVDDRGIGETTADFEFNPQTGEFELSFEVPALLANGTATRTDTTSGACNETDNGSKTSPGGSYSIAYNKSPVRISGVASPGLDSLRGQQMLDLGPQASIPGVSMSHQAIVTFVFYRVN